MWDAKVPLGKYKGYEYQVVAIMDPAYFMWLLTKCDCRKVRRWRRKMEKKLDYDFSSSDS